MAFLGQCNSNYGIEFLYFYNISVDAQDPDENVLLCQVYVESRGPCAEDFECSVIDGRPSCQYVFQIIVLNCFMVKSNHDIYVLASSSCVTKVVKQPISSLSCFFDSFYSTVLFVCFERMQLSIEEHLGLCRKLFFPAITGITLRHLLNQNKIFQTFITYTKQDVLL